MLPENIKSIIIHTGNVISSKEMKKKTMQSPSEEVCDSVSGTFHAWIKSYKPESPLDSDSIFCDNSLSIKVVKLERDNLKISVKIFADSISNSNVLRDSIFHVMEVIDVTTIDSLILSLSSDKKFDLNKVKPLWIELENLVAEEKIITIGISDLDSLELLELYNWSQVKPSVNQVNLESCCVMPVEMIAFAKEKDIQLLTHNDPKVLLPDEMLLKVLEPGVKHPEQWKISWIVRYSVVVKCRGIVQNKGYLLCVVKR